MQRVKDQANKCNFAALKDDLSLSQFIFGLADQSIREKLLAKPELDLATALQECQFLETASAASLRRDYSMTLNKVIDPDSYQIPKLEEIAKKVAGACVYSVLDLTDAYLQIPLSDESQRYTCISTHIGHFQEIMEKVLSGISRVAIKMISS